jgi:hypothetical protein
VLAEVLKHGKVFDITKLGETTDKVFDKLLKERFVVGCAGRWDVDVRDRQGGGEGRLDVTARAPISMAAAPGLHVKSAELSISLEKLIRDTLAHCTRIQTNRRAGSFRG